MTRAEKNVIKRLKDFPAIRPLEIGNTYYIDGYRTTEAMLVKMRKKGLLKMGWHPMLKWKWTFIVNMDNDKVSDYFRKLQGGE